MQDDQLATTIVKATKDALQQWRLAARFQNIQINGPIAVSGAGCLVGPRLDNNVAALQILQGEDKTIALAAMKGIADLFDRWRMGVSVPGLAWYPQFAAYPGPMAPPTPNVPCKLAQLASNSGELTSAPKLESAMTVAGMVPGKMPDPRFAVVFKKVASQLTMEFTMFINNSTVMNVLGQGPVPTFQPPAAMMGAVVGGFTIPMTGMLT